ncbi:MAG: GMC family oxidoreductase N-terminal domain-containing protein [bacterium]|nr:GMC family oxidoreductase N-terminal domain-containing protein [bacterium]
MTSVMNHDTYDYVVVGAGSAGCVVAARLSEQPDVRVLLLEAGGPDSHPDVQNPVMWPTLFKGELDWGYDTQPLRHANDRIDHIPRGKMLGGCHSHNASAWVRGHSADFDTWADQGNAGWDWQSVLRLYRKIENWQGPASELRGTGGPMWVTPNAEPNPIAAAFVEAGSTVGIPSVADNNGPTMEGTSFFNLTIKDGRRYSVVHAYLQPAIERPNLTVLTCAETQRLSLDGTRCVGVNYVHDDTEKTAFAEQEVILCAGVIGSPRALLLSGIGPAKDLNELGIPVVADLAGVGRNLQDHPLLGGINYECKGALPEPRNNGAESAMWWRSDPQLTSPNIQAVILEFPFATPELVGRLPSEHCYAIAPSVARPASRGTVKLVSADPSVAPAIDVNFLARDADIEAMLVAVDICREMGASSAYNDLRKREIMPGNLGRADMIEFIRQSVSTYFHPTGTCKMGIDAQSVVDPELRVCGITGLRVADASVMPTVTTGNTNAPTVMIGEMAAELVQVSP